MIEKMDGRRKSFEAKFKLDEETAFKIRNRRNKYLGVWLAERLGMTESETDPYAKQVVMSDLDEPGDDDVLRKVMKDIADRGAEISEDDVRGKLDEIFVVAAEEITSESP